MKRATFVLAGLTAGCLAFTAGCGSHSASSVRTSDPALKGFPGMGQAMAKNPELTIRGMQTPKEKAAYLQELAKDSNFDPKMHKEMLDKYSTDSDPDVAAAAKDLLDKAK